MTIAFDFDGVIHKYTGGWKDGEIYDPLFDEWFKLVDKLLSLGHNVFIMSTRPKKQIIKYMKDHYYDNTPEMPDLPCNNIWSCGFGFRSMPFWEKFYKTKMDAFYKTVGVCNHKAIFDVLIDDRAITFSGSYEGMEEKILSFRPWGNK